MNQQDRGEVNKIIQTQRQQAGFGLSVASFHTHNGIDSAKISIFSLQNISQAFALGNFKWGSGGNTVTISNQYVKTTSFIQAQVTGSTPPNGLWAIKASNGKFTITSSDSENSTLPVSYMVVNI